MRGLRPRLSRRLTPTIFWCRSVQPRPALRRSDSCHPLRAIAYGKPQKFAVLAFLDPTSEPILHAGDRDVAVVIWLGVLLFALIAEQSAGHIAPIRWGRL